MNNLSVYFECVLVLNLVSCSNKIFLDRGVIYCILARIVVRLEMLGELLVLVVRTIVRVFLQMCTDCLEKRCVLMIGGYFLDYLLVLCEVFETLLVGTDVRVVD